ncbi:hypothetical protein [Halobaculum sp. EA56]|uniref:hypothetical protein n=1 Tax=Halobaculum sp. EA56 TaxID=3421648 RepID=UPI003EB91C1F
MPTRSTDHDSELGARLRRVLDGSTLVRAGRTLRDRAADSTLATLGRRLASGARNSFVYRWLTKEPEPEVIVIDLRETWTVGPVIALLDRLVEWVVPYWRGSRLKRGLDRTAALGERAADTRAGRLLVRVLEPPEPPDERTGENRTTESGDPSNADATAERDDESR